MEWRNMLESSEKSETMIYKLIKALRSVIVIILIIIALNYLSNSL